MALKICFCCAPFQSQSLEPDQFPQDPSMMIDQKPPMYTQQFAPPPSHMVQRGYPSAAMQEQGFHPISSQMGPRPGYPMMRMQARPGLRPAGVVPNQPNTLRLQLQHRLQSQQVHLPLHCPDTAGRETVHWFFNRSYATMLFDQSLCVGSCVIILEVDILAQGVVGTFRSTCHLLDFHGIYCNNIHKVALKLCHRKD